MKISFQFSCPENAVLRVQVSGLCMSVSESEYAKEMYGTIAGRHCCSLRKTYIKTHNKSRRHLIRAGGSHILQYCFHPTSIPPATSSRTPLPASASTIVSANSIAAAGPLPVIMFPSHSTIAPVTVAPANLSSKPG